MTNQQCADKIKDMSATQMNTANPNISGEYAIIPMGTSGTGIDAQDVINVVYHLSDINANDADDIDGSLEGFGAILGTKGGRPC